MRQLKIAKQITNRETESVDRYLQEIARISLISPEEEVVLAQRIRSGDKAALIKLTSSNLRFVVSVAKQYQNQGLSLADLINEGNIGLIKAAQRFDETKGFKFISYAVWWIRQTILQAIAENAYIVRLPLNKLTTINKINRAYGQFEQQNMRGPNIDEIAEIVGGSLTEIIDAQKCSLKHTSVDAPLEQDEEYTLLDLMQNEEDQNPEYNLNHESLKIEIERSMSSLINNEAEILRNYFGLSGKAQMSLDEIAYKFEISRERARQIKDKAIRHLRKYSRNRNLKPYLG